MSESMEWLEARGLDADFLPEPKRQIKTFNDEYGRHALIATRDGMSPVRDVIWLLAEQDLQIGIGAAYMSLDYQPRHAASEAS